MGRNSVCGGANDQWFSPFGQRDCHDEQSKSTSCSEVLDYCGNCMAHAEAINSPEMRWERRLPEGLVESCKPDETRGR